MIAGEWVMDFFCGKRKLALAATEKGRYEWMDGRTDGRTERIYILMIVCNELHWFISILFRNAIAVHHSEEDLEELGDFLRQAITMFLITMTSHDK